MGSKSKKLVSLFAVITPIIPTMGCASQDDGDYKNSSSSRLAEDRDGDGFPTGKHILDLISQREPATKTWRIIFQSIYRGASNVPSHVRF